MAASIAEFRTKVPALQGDEVYLNSGFNAPWNDISNDAIIDFINYTRKVLNPKPYGLAKVEETRDKFADFVNTSRENITFTRDTSEGLILFQKSVKFEKGDNVVLLAGDFPHPVYGWLELERSQGVEIRFVETDESNVKSYGHADFEPYIDEKTKVVALSSVMFHTGLKNDVKSLTKNLRSKGIHVLVDGTQEIGFAKVDVKELGVSAMAFGIFKGLGCPTGAGVLYVDPETIKELKPLPPVLSTAGVSNPLPDLRARRDLEVHPNALRYEHDNKAFLELVALGASLDYLKAIGIENIESYLAGLGSYLISELSAAGVKPVGVDDAVRSVQSYVIPLKNPGWVQLFADNKIVLSQYRCGVRVSLGLYNNKDDIDKFIAVLKKGLESGLEDSPEVPQA